MNRNLVSVKIVVIYNSGKAILYKASMITHINICMHLPGAASYIVNVDSDRWAWEKKSYAEIF